MKKIFVSITLLTMLYCCNSSDVNKKDTTQLPLSNDSSEPNVLQKSERVRENYDTTNVYRKISANSKVTILSSKKIFDTTSKFFALYKLKCESWVLTQNEIKKVILVSEEITGEEFHHFYDVLPCYYIGDALIDNKRVKYTLNSGAFANLSFADTAITLGYKKNNYAKYFIIGPGAD
jgi:hypothetical protein